MAPLTPPPPNLALPDLPGSLGSPPGPEDAPGRHSRQDPDGPPNRGRLVRRVPQRVPIAPAEPSPSPWRFPEVVDLPQDLVALGADLRPGTLLAAYRAGLFPMPSEADNELGWFSPVDRAILPIDGLRVTRSMRQAARRYEASVDLAFAEVMRGCADPARPGAWIDDAFLLAYQRLYQLGWAHSVEVWRDGRLAGGLYGVAIGGLFCGESMFHVERDASKVALMALIDVLDDGVSGRLLDVQWSTPHLASLGVIEVGRARYVELLRRALELPTARFG